MASKKVSVDREYLEFIAEQLEVASQEMQDEPKRVAQLIAEALYHEARRPGRLGMEEISYGRIQG